MASDISFTHTPSVVLVILFSLFFPIPMVKFSLQSWVKDKFQLQAGTSFTPTLTGHVKTFVIDTVDNATKFRMPNPKGFVNISRVHWPAALSKSVSRKNKDLTGMEVAFGKGSWRPADDFMGFSYSSLSTLVLLHFAFTADT